MGVAYDGWGWGVGYGFSGAQYRLCPILFYVKMLLDNLL